MIITKFIINGETYSVDLNTLPADITLNTFIREHAGLTATKFMCQEGGCGVCVCTVTGKHPATGEIRTWAVNSCLTLLNCCADWEITTSEGLGNKRSGYHAIQERLAKLNGTQCGYCSPGFVMNMYGLLKSKHGKVTMQEVEDSFGGNICRCTGYRPILDAMKSFAVDSNIEIPPECQTDIEDLNPKACPKTGQPCSGLCNGASQNLTQFKHNNGTEWFWPKSIDEIFGVYKNLGDKKYILVAGNTAHGVYRRPHNIKTFIDVNGISELKKFSITDTSIVLGANLSLNEAMEVFEKASKVPGFEYCKQLRQHFDLIANVPVRNMGTLAGNLTIKHNYKEFPSDVFITFETLDAEIVVRQAVGQKQSFSPLDFLKVDLTKKVIESLILKPYPQLRYTFDSFKIMSVAQNVHAYVNAGFLLDFNRSKGIVKSARICFGGINEDFVHAQEVEQFIIGKSLFDDKIISDIFNIMKSRLSAESVLPEASPIYKEKLAMGLLYKFILSLTPNSLTRSEYKSGGSKLIRPLSSGKQIFEFANGHKPIGLPTEKHEGIRQTSGEIMYTNDLATQSNQLWAAFVTAKKVGATVTNIDVSEALALPGVVGYFSARDIPGENNIVMLKDYMQLFKEVEPLFETGHIRYYNQPIGIIVAKSNIIANHGVELVKLSYSDASAEVFATTKKVLLEKVEERIIQEAISPIEKIHFTGPYDHKETGSIDMGLQYHYFMEPHATVVIPCETGFEVHSATQWMDLMQGSISKLLKIDANEVQIKVRRVGGAYGGKATRCLPAACAAALAAYHLKCPVRFVQSLESIIRTLGKRMPLLSNYEFYVKNNGKIVALINKFYQNLGFLLNESTIPLTVIGALNCYDIDDKYKLDGFCIRSDSPANTACRAPGSLETIAMIENIMEHIAFVLNMDPLEVRLANIQSDHKIIEMMNYFVTSSDYYKRREEVKVYNQNNRWRKKGLGISIMDYRIDFFGQFPLTMAAYHTDGSVIISHGRIEMGQGLNTKIAQVAAHDLGIPMDRIKFDSSNTVNGANSIVTGASFGSEALGHAVRKCCKTLNDRLKPVRDDLKNPNWQVLLEAAYKRNINMVVSDNFEQDELESYTVCGLALTEVEVDILTGKYLVSRVDLLEDVGESLNPNIDVGQVEGAFVMGLGYWTSEQILVNESTGEITTDRSWNYKPPGAKDIPVDFRVEFLPRSSNTAGFMRSKATGEPAICLSVSVAFALQQAMQSARDDAGLVKKWVPLVAPLSPEFIVLNAGTNENTFSLK